MRPKSYEPKKKKVKVQPRRKITLYITNDLWNLIERNRHNINLSALFRDAFLDWAHNRPNNCHSLKEQVKVMRAKLRDIRKKAKIPKYYKFYPSRAKKSDVESAT